MINASSISTSPRFVFVFFCSQGDFDDPSAKDTQEYLVVKLENFRIGLIHGHQVCHTHPDLIRFGLCSSNDAFFWVLNKAFCYEVVLLFFCKNISPIQIHRFYNWLYFVDLLKPSLTDFVLLFSMVFLPALAFREMLCFWGYFDVFLAGTKFVPAMNTCDSLASFIIFFLIRTNSFLSSLSNVASFLVPIILWFCFQSTKYVGKHCYKILRIHRLKHFSPRTLFIIFATLLGQLPRSS